MKASQDPPGTKSCTPESETIHTILGSAAGEEISMILANQHPHTASWPLELALGDVGEDSVGGRDIVLTGSVGDAVQAQHDTLPLGALHVECEAVVGELHHLGILPSENHYLPGVT